MSAGPEKPDAGENLRKAIEDASKTLDRMVILGRELMDLCAKWVVEEEKKRRRRKRHKKQKQKKKR